MRGPKVGEKIHIKSWEEIKKTLSSENRSKRDLYFNPIMRSHCGEILTVDDTSASGRLVSEGWYWEPEWYTPTEAIATITIDLTDPKSAHAAVKDAIRNYENRPREWTNDEIAKAGKMADEMILELHHKRLSPVLYYMPEEKRTSLSLDFGLPSKEEFYNTQVHGNDAYNEVIGRCVCLCKATGRDIPDFIRK